VNRSFPGSENPADAGFLNEYNRPEPVLPGRQAKGNYAAQMVIQRQIKTTALKTKAAVLELTS